MVEFTENHPKTIKIKLKLSKDENEEDEKIVGAEKVDFELDDEKQIQSKEKVCEVCGKVFGSGKALGGHMRIHFQASKDRIIKENKKKKLIAQKSTKLEKFKNSSGGNSLDEFGSDETTCALCRKIFPSMKSLFGHMRCHPEREWRGIHPPPSPSPSPSPSPRRSDDELIATDDDDDELLEPVNLMEVLPSWSVTAKRRGKTSNVMVDDVEDEFREGVDHLMMLSKGTGDSSSDLAKNNQKGESSEVVGLFGDEDQTLMKNELVNEHEGKGSNDGVLMNLSGGKCKDNVVESEDELKRCENNSPIRKEGLIMKRKKMKLIRDLDEIQDDSLPLVIHHTPPPPPQAMASPAASTASAMPEKYKCSICGKGFPTHQALGGHKSSHNKFRMFIHNSIDDRQLGSPPSAKKVRRTMKENQEKDEGVGTQQNHQYLSKVCNKIFHSGQTLGGCHWDNNVSPSEVEAQSISVQDKVVSHTNTGRVLDFDLNELPPVEDDHI